MTVRLARPRAAILLAALLIARSATAASLEQELDPIEADSNEIQGRTARLESDTRPGSYLSENEAITRFQDYLFLHLIGENGPAAEGFFALVTTGALTEEGLHRDAEWYLGESLVGLGNLKTAAARFQLMVDDASHPFRDDAVRRLLEIYARTGERDAFRALYDKEIVPGKVKPTGLITYSLAKSFEEQGDLRNARAYFEQVPPDNAWYGRARYRLGVLDVREGNLEQAKVHFKEVADLSIETTEDRQVHDLAMLALGRISYHLADYPAASEYYNAIGGDSAYQADRLYEIIWTSIRLERWGDALNNTQIFLLAFPEHHYAAQLRLLEGHLNFQEQNWGDALVAYEQVINDYMPVQARFAALAAPGSEADAAVRAVLESQTQSADLPPFAVSMMRNDPDLARAMTVFRELEGQRRDIETSEKLIEELKGLVLGAGALGSYERSMADAYAMRSRVLQHRLALLDLEQRWLAGAGGDAAARLGDLGARRAALVDRHKGVAAQVEAANAAISVFERQMAEHHAEADNARRDAAAREARITELRTDLEGPKGAVPEERDRILAEIQRLEVERGDAIARMHDADAKLAAVVAPDVGPMVDRAALEALGGEVAALAAAFADARPQRSGVPIADRMDATHRVLEDAFGRLGGVIQAVDQGKQSEVGAIRQRFEEEVQNVAVERADYDATLGRARAVSLELTRQGFGRLEDFFADSVLKADMGIVDVYWAQKLEIADELARVCTEKEESIDDLERRFELIRAKMGEPL